MIAFVDKMRDRFGAELVCRVMRQAEVGFLTAGGYRAAKARPASARQLRDELLIPEIVRLHAENYGVYGVCKMHALLRRQGWVIGRDQTGRLMPIAGVYGVKRSSAGSARPFGPRSKTAAPANTAMNRPGQDARVAAGERSGWQGE